MSNIIGDSNNPQVPAVQGTQGGNGGMGVLGIGPANGVIGQSTGSGFAGVYGESATGPGVSGPSTSSVGMDAKTVSGPAALRAVHAGNGVAGLFGGDVHVTHNLHVDGDINVNDGDIRLTSADCAEDFDIAGSSAAEPGTVYTKSHYPAKGQVFIHELTHAWQIRAKSFVPGLLCKAFGQTRTYHPDAATHEWSEQGLEQQASIVDEWFGRHSGEWETLDQLKANLSSQAAVQDEYFGYIDRHIRLGQN